MYAQCESVTLVQQLNVPQSDRQAGRQKVLRAMERESMHLNETDNLICETAQYSSCVTFLPCRALMGALPPITISLNSLIPIIMGPYWMNYIYAG